MNDDRAKLYAIAASYVLRLRSLIGQAPLSSARVLAADALGSLSDRLTEMALADGVDVSMLEGLEFEDAVTEPWRSPREPHRSGAAGSRNDRNEKP